MMNREIKFRGLRTDGKGWVYGYYTVSHYCSQGSHATIQPSLHCSVKVDLRTVGQFTGLQDKNGVDIYEGDKLKTPNGDWGYVVWKSPSFELTVSEDQSSLYTLEWLMQCEVIGNIFKT